MMIMRPPAILFLSLLLGYFLNALYPVSTAVYPPFNFAGLALIPIGIFPVFWTIKVFHEKGTTHKPGQKPSVLVTTGLFRYTRNPIYLGFLFISMGFAIYMSSISAFAAPIAYFIAMDYRVIPAEEKAIGEAFGKKYDEYKARVRRWF